MIECHGPNANGTQDQIAITQDSTLAVLLNISDGVRGLDAGSRWTPSGDADYPFVFQVNVATVSIPTTAPDVSPVISRDWFSAIFTYDGTPVTSASASAVALLDFLVVLPPSYNLSQTCRPRFKRADCLHQVHGNGREYYEYLGSADGFPVHLLHGQQQQASGPVLVPLQSSLLDTNSAPPALCPRSLFLSPSTTEPMDFSLRGFAIWPFAMTSTSNLTSKTR